MRMLVAVVLAVPLLASAHDPGPAAAAGRDAWYLGFGIGTGTGSAGRPGGRASFQDLSVDRPTNGFFNVRAGATLSERLLLGGEFSGISAVANEAGIDSTVSVANLDVVATFFPTGRGLALRGGAGWSRFDRTLEGAGLDADQRRDGANVMAGVGYAWWLGRSFNLSLNLDLFQQWYGPSDSFVESSRCAVAYLGFDWY